MSKFSQCVDLAYERGTVPLSVAIFVLYVAPLGDWRAYALVPMACALLPLLCTMFALTLHRRGVLRYVWDAVHGFVGGAFMRVWLGVEQLRQSKPGQVLLWLALINASHFGGYWCYVNVDLLKLGRSLALMLYTLVTSLRDPVALLHSFQETLRTLSVYRAMEAVRLGYVNATVEGIDQGSVSILFPVLVITGLLVLAATAFYWFPNHVLPIFSQPYGLRATRPLGREERPADADVTVVTQYK